jgi:CDP-diacylglycerol--serine O-phosphatidyltransferase
MIGFYNYTVILTYLSMASATTGIMLCLNDIGHPYIGMFFLMFCGLCDAFDGKVARTKKNRTETENKFGIQIDSLSDLVAFGVLPVCIGMAMVRRSNLMDTRPVIGFILAGVMLLYLLAGMIRLAYFNVTEEERQKKEKGVRRTYLGLPITSAALIFPTVMLIQFISKNVDITPVYFGVALLMGVLFLSKIRIGKPGLKGILLMVAIGAAEFLIMTLMYFING